MVELIDSEQSEDEAQSLSEEIIKFNAPKELEKVSKKQVAPWMTGRTKDIKDALLRFHNEIIEFAEYVSPTTAEHASREKALLE